MEIQIKNGKYGEELRLEEEAGKTLLSILQENHIYLDAPCSGKGDCGRCRVRFLEGAPEPAQKETRLLTDKECEEGVRLACTVRVCGDCRIELPEAETEQMAVLAGASKECNSRCKAGSCGIAIDIGTTTLAMALVDLTSGKQLAVSTAVNHQRSLGADVISRIQASNEGKGALLRADIRADLKRMIRELLIKTGTAPGKVEKIAVAGNTVMCHILLGYSCETLGAAPFLPFDASLQKKCYQELFGTELSAEVTILPGISAFVGADITAGIYYSGMAEQTETSVLLDIGTNGEMVIGNRDGFLVTSAAGGPVFEGGGISCGVPGIPGAVSHVSLGRRTAADSATCIDKERKGTVFCSSMETLQGKNPVGLCGTGIIDLVSGLYQERMIDENGTLKEPWFTEGFSLDGGSIQFIQQDIRMVQMGKAAIRAGIEVLLSEYLKRQGVSQTKCVRGIAKEDSTRKAFPIEYRVYLAGGFGYFMDVDKAVHIGLFPESFLGRVKAMGNTALLGAIKFLTDPMGEEKVKWIAEHAEEIKLAEYPSFEEWYLKYMNFEGGKDG